MKTRKELKEAGYTDSQISDLMKKGVCLFNCKSDIERLEKERNSPKCCYCGRSIVKPATVFVYRRTDDNIYCSDKCARRDGNFCVGGVYSFEGEVYERYFANQEGR